AALDELFGDLDGVKGGALSDVVADEPEGDAVLVRGVLADAADVGIVSAGDVPGRGIDVDGRLVLYGDAGRLAKDVVEVFRGDRLRELNVDGFRVAGVDGHADAGRGDGELRVVEALVGTVAE